MATRRSRERPKSNQVSLSTPWSGKAHGNGYSATMSNSAGIPSDAVAEVFLVERTRLHELYVREQERTRRVGLILAAVLILAAAAMILFAPAGREILSYWIGAALIVFAAGTVGYKRVWGK